MSATVSDKPWATEAGHWYTRTGQPAYTVTGKNGKVRATTLRDARELGLVPSVTSIVGLVARPGLERWKAEQVLLAALTLPREPEESESAWVGRVWDDSRRQAKNAAERGVAIHGAIEAAYGGGSYSLDLAPWVSVVGRVIKGEWGSDQLWSPERSFADPQMGYGGKVDLHGPAGVIDFKGKDGDPSTWRIYDEHVMQLAAYAMGLGLTDAKCGVVFFSRTEPIALSVVIPRDDLTRGCRMFIALLEYWKASRGIA